MPPHGKILKFILLRLAEHGPVTLERALAYTVYHRKCWIQFLFIKISYRAAAGHHPGQRVVPAVGAGRLRDPHHGLHLLSFHDCHAALIQVPYLLLP